MCLKSTQQQQQTMRTRTHWTSFLLLAVWLGGLLFSVGSVIMFLLFQNGFGACYFHFVRHQAPLFPISSLLMEDCFICENERLDDLKK